MAPFLMLANDRYHVQAIQNGSPLLRRFEEAPPDEQAMLLSMYGSVEAYWAAYAKFLATGWGKRICDSLQR